jgi:hypothetical protein
MSVGVDIIPQPQTQSPTGVAYEGTDTTAVVLYNPFQHVEIPPLPNVWITVHQSAVSASLVAGATTYAISKMSGQLVTYSVATGVRYSGSLLSGAVRLVQGDMVANQVQRHTSTLANLVQSVGDSCTNVTSLVASSTVAAVVGATTMVGSMCQTIYQSIRSAPQENPQQSVEDSHDYEFVLCEVRPLDPTGSGPHTTSQPCLEGES